jgi:hypothetical protein
MQKPVLWLSVMLLWPTVSRAADKIQPLDVRLGAWESTTISDISGVEIPPDALAQMSPRERAQAEAALKARTSRGPSKTTRQSCVTKESVDKLYDDTNSRSNCKRTVIESTRREQVFHEECADASAKSSSDVHFEAVDSTHVKGSVRAVVTRAGGVHPIHMNMTFNAHWIGPSCSDIKKGS